MNLNNIITETILREIAVSGDNLVDNYVILVKQGDKYVLYNYAYQQIVAYASTKTLTSGYIMIDNVAADKGYGPIIHDIVLMDVFPKEVRCDEELTEASVKIWQYYYSKRLDVKKNRMPESLISTQLTKYGEESLLYSYSLSPTTWFNNLKVKSDILIEKYNLNKLDILVNGEYFFNEKYGEYFV